MIWRVPSNGRVIWRCRVRWLALTVKRKSTPSSCNCQERSLGVQGIRLDEQALQNQLAQQLFVHSAVMVFIGGIAGLADRQTRRRRVERYLGDEPRPVTCCGFDRAAQGLTIADELIQTLCATRDLGDRPITDGRAQRHDVHRQEQIPQRRIRW